MRSVSKNLGIGLIICLLPVIVHAQVNTKITIEQDIASIDLVVKDGFTILTMDSSVQRASYTRYFFDSSEWNSKIGSLKNSKGPLRLEISASPRQSPPPDTTSPGPKPQGGISLKDFNAKILNVLLPKKTNQALPPLEIFQGILPTASGPGMEVILYLYADGESFMRYCYLSHDQKWFSEFGTWVLSDNRLTVQSLQDDGLSFLFLRRANILEILAPDGQLPYQGIPRSVLVLISR